MRIFEKIIIFKKSEFALTGQIYIGVRIMNFLLLSYVLEADLVELLAHVENNIRVFIMESLVFQTDNGHKVIIVCAFRRIIITGFSVRLTRESPRLS